MKTLPMDAEMRIEESSGDATAAALLWWTNAPTLPGERLGVVGGFNATGEAAARQVLERAGTELRNRGCTLALGPMDGNTWRSYRWVTEAGTEPPFLLEPRNPPEWPAWWRAAGFTPFAEYYSSVTDDLATRDQRLAGVRTRMSAAGVVIRTFDPARFEAELNRIYDVSVISFRDNFLYTPLARGEFVAQYASLREKIRPEFVLVAEHAGRPIGYVFALPDYAQAQRGEPVTTLIVKTLAVLPGRAWAGLGALLLAEVQAQAHRRGFKRAIHALMHETNKSRNLSAHYARTIRRYTLFARRL